MKADSLANRADLIARRRRGHHARAVDGEKWAFRHSRQCEPFPH